MPESEDLDISEELFPVEDVQACKSDGDLQREGRAELDPDTEEALAASRKGAIEAGAPATIKWIYFRSPPCTWEGLCGQEGWLLVDPKTCQQFDFFLTLLN